MAFLEFGPKYIVGVPEVDEQHKKLFTLLNTLHEATVDGKEQTALVNILNDLVEYTIYHFRTEEDLYIKYEFPDYESHKAEHDKLMAQVMRLQQQFRDGSATVSFDLLDFLHRWLVEHTTGLDQVMGPFLNSKGVC